MSKVVCVTSRKSSVGNLFDTFSLSPLRNLKNTFCPTMPGKRQLVHSLKFRVWTLKSEPERICREEGLTHQIIRFRKASDRCLPNAQRTSLREAVESFYWKHLLGFLHPNVCVNDQLNDVLIALRSQVLLMKCVSDQGDNGASIAISFAIWTSLDIFREKHLRLRQCFLCSSCVDPVY